MTYLFHSLPGYTLPHVSLPNPRAKTSLGYSRAWTSSGTLIITLPPYAPQTRASPDSVMATTRSSEHRKDWILYRYNNTTRESPKGIVHVCIKKHNTDTYFTSAINKPMTPSTKSFHGPSTYWPNTDTLTIDFNMTISILNHHHTYYILHETYSLYSPSVIDVMGLVHQKWVMTLFNYVH